MHTAIVKPQWAPLSIALMVLGFIVFWPLGLAVLAYILWGEYMGGSAEKAERWIHKQKEWARGCRHHRHDRHGFGQGSGNAAFDDYREEQLKRLDEERRRLDEDVREFQDYMRNLHKARDREEFDRFINERRKARDSESKPDDRSSSDDDHRQGY